jgi:hypothetical protein
MTARGPLDGLRILEFAAIGPVPFCGMPAGAGDGVASLASGASDRPILRSADSGAFESI